VKKISNTSGKRKRAVARASVQSGNGKVTVNNKPIESITPKLARMKMMEPLLLIGGEASKYNITIRVNGGGIMSQADAIRLAISRGLVDFTKDKKLEKTFLEYDRQLLVADIRVKETCKPNDSKARSKRQKSYR